MAAKNKESTAGEFIQQSIRFAPGHVIWLSNESKRLGASVNAIVRQLVDDSLTFFGLPPTMVETLRRDQKALGLDFRQYLQDLLTQRYRDLLRAEVNGSAKGKR